MARERRGRVVERHERRRDREEKMLNKMAIEKRIKKRELRE